MSNCSLPRCLFMFTKITWPILLHISECKADKVEHAPSTNMVLMLEPHICTWAVWCFCFVVNVAVRTIHHHRPHLSEASPQTLTQHLVQPITVPTWWILLTLVIPWLSPHCVQDFVTKISKDINVSPSCTLCLVLNKFQEAKMLWRPASHFKN